MTHLIDMNEIERILKLAGLDAECAGSGGDQFSIFIKPALDDRYTVIAGPGTEAMLDGVYSVYGTLGEFGFLQDTEECSPAYAVREHETPAMIASRIIRLHKRVLARREARRLADPADLKNLPLTVEPIEGEDVHTSHLV